MAIYYVSTSGNDNPSSGGGTDPANPFANPPSNISKNVTGSSTAEGITLTAGDVIKFKRGDKWTYTGFLWLYQRTDLTLTTYYNADGSDDQSQPLPIIDTSYDRLGATWTNDTGLDANAWYTTHGSGVDGCVFDDEDSASSIKGTQMVSADFTLDGNSEYTISSSVEPHWVVDTSALSTPRTRGTAGSLAAGEWDWAADVLYVKDDPTDEVVLSITLSASQRQYYQGTSGGRFYVYSTANPSGAFSHLSLLTRGATDSRDGNTYRQSSYCMIIEDSSGITVDGLDLRHAESAQVYMPNSVSQTTLGDITFTNCDLGGFNQSVLYDNNHTTYEPTDIRFINNTFHRDWTTGNNYTGGTEAEPGGNCFNLQGGSSGMLFRHNVISGWGHDCLSIYTSPGVVRDLIFEYNDLRQGASNYCRAIGISYNPSDKLVGMQFRYNRDMTNQQNKLQGTNCRYYGNIIHKHNAENSGFLGQVSTLSPIALIVKSDTNMVSEGVEVFNNLIYNVRGNGVQFTNQAGSTLGDNSFYNNIVLTTGWDTSEGNSDRYAIRCDYGATGTFGTQHIYNNLIHDFFTQGSTDYVHVEDNDQSVHTHTNAEAATAFTYWHDNLVDDPVLDANFFPTALSPVAGAGAPTGNYFDLYMRPSSGNHIGAVWPFVETNKTRRKL